MATTFVNFFTIFTVVLLGFGAAYIGLLVEVGTFSMKRNVIGMVYYTYFQVCIHYLQFTPYNSYHVYLIIVRILKLINEIIELR